MLDHGVHGSDNHAFFTSRLVACFTARPLSSCLLKSQPVSKVRRSAWKPNASAQSVTELLGLQQSSKPIDHDRRAVRAHKLGMQLWWSGLLYLRNWIHLTRSGHCYLLDWKSCPHSSHRRLWRYCTTRSGHRYLRNRKRLTRSGPRRH